MTVSYPGGSALDSIDDQHFDPSFARFKLQPELFRPAKS